MDTPKTFPLRLSLEQHAAINRRAKAAGLPMYKYIIELCTTGKINTKARKSTN